MAYFISEQVSFRASKANMKSEISQQV